MKQLLTISVVIGALCFFTTSAGAQNRRISNIEDEVAPKHSFMTVSTNVLQDAVLIPNIGLEFNLYNNWTLAVNGMWAWWTNENIHWYWRIYGGEVAVKKYLGKRALKRSMTGHHVGIYGQALSYDFEVGHFGRMSPKLSYGGGVEYGYSFPVSNVFNIDISLGVGYLGGRFYEYVENEGHYVWRATVQQNWFGPTKGGVSLVWLIDAKKKR